MTRFSAACLVLATAVLGCGAKQVKDSGDGGKDHGGDAGPRDGDGGLGGGGGGGPACDAFTDTTCADGTICDLEDVCVAPQYTVGSDGTVSDDVTGLVWQRAVPETPCPSGQGGCAWTDAQTYCANLRLGGATDWRLPTLPELFSLLDMGRLPTINSNAFPSTAIDGPFWTASPFQSGMTRVWIVYFDDGDDGSNPSDFGLIRCVR